MVHMIDEHKQVLVQYIVMLYNTYLICSAAMPKLSFASSSALVALSVSCAHTDTHAQQQRQYTDIQQPAGVSTPTAATTQDECEAAAQQCDSAVGSTTLVL
jgi:hypothetical protein